MYNKPEIRLETGFEKTVRLGLIILTSLCFVIALMGGYTQYHNWSYSIPIMAAFFVIIMVAVNDTGENGFNVSHLACGNIYISIGSKAYHVTTLAY